MGFDVSKLKDDPGIPKLGFSLGGRMPDVGRRVAVDAAIPRSFDRSVVAGGWAKVEVLASRTVATPENSLLRAFVGIPSRSTLEAARPSGAFGWGISTLGDSPLVKTLSKFGSLAAAESQSNTTLNASMMRGVAGSFQNLYTLQESTRSWQSNYDISFGKAALEHVAAVERTIVGEYTSSAIGFAQPVGIRSPDIARRMIQGFVMPHEPPWIATLESIFGAPLFNSISKVAAGYAGWAQRIGELFEVWRPKLVGVSEWLRREMEQWPRDPYGDLVPIWNVRLYRLAQSS